jgi:Holliday junction resolvase-like predicted endonuclease
MYFRLPICIEGERWSKVVNNQWSPNENDIIEAVVNKLKHSGFDIISTCNTNEHGIDIIAKKGKLELYVEAKGGTTSKETSRSGKPFTRNQVHTHISVALYTVMKLFSKYKDCNNVLIGIALPFEKNHIDFIKAINNALHMLSIIVFWVKEDGVIINALGDNLELFY